MTEPSQDAVGQTQPTDESAESSPLVLMGNPLLRAIAAPVEGADADVARLVAHMVEVMRQCQGVGLAAPQIGVGKRVIVYEIPPSRVTDDDERAPEGVHVLINPVIEPVSEGMIDGIEGCLSIPGLRGIVPRHASVWFRGFGLGGEEIEGLAEGFHARVLQHEVDHLDGVLFLDRMKSMRQLAFEHEAHNLTEMIG